MLGLKRTGAKVVRVRVAAVPAFERWQIAERKQLREFLMKHYPVPEHIAQSAETMK